MGYYGRHKSQRLTCEQFLGLVCLVLVLILWNVVHLYLEHWGWIERRT